MKQKLNQNALLKVMSSMGESRANVSGGLSTLEDVLHNFEGHPT